jgi:hypothetical protein
MQATYFDGKTARAHPVELSIDGDMLLIAGDGHRVPAHDRRGRDS